MVDQLSRNASGSDGLPTTARIDAPPLVTPGLRETILTCAPHQCSRLGSTAVGIALHRKDIPDPTFAEISMVAVFVDAKDPARKPKLMFLLAGQARPYVVAGDQIQFREFPEVAAETVPASLRNLLRFLRGSNRALAFDTGTWEFATNARAAFPVRSQLALASGLVRAQQHREVSRSVSRAANDPGQPALQKTRPSSPVEPAPAPVPAKHLENQALSVERANCAQELRSPEVAKQLTTVTPRALVLSPLHPASQLLDSVTAQLDRAEAAARGLRAATAAWREALTRQQELGAPITVPASHADSQALARAARMSQDLVAATEHLRLATLVTCGGHGITLTVAARSLYACARELQPDLRERDLDRVRYLADAGPIGTARPPVRDVLAALARLCLAEQEIDAARVSGPDHPWLARDARVVRYASVCPRCGAQLEPAESCPSCGELPGSQQPETLLQRCGALLEEALGEQESPAISATSLRQALIAAHARVGEAERSVTQTDSKLAVRSSIGCQLAVIFMGVEETVVASLDHCPRRLVQAQSALYAATWLLIGDPARAEVRRLLARQVEVDAAALAALFAQPDDAFPTEPVRVASALDTATRVALPDHAEALARVEAVGSGAEIAGAVALAWRRLGTGLGHGPLAAIVQRHCASHWGEIWWALLRLRAAALLARGPR